MNTRPQLPLTVDRLPIQRLVEVIDLPPKPAAFNPTLCHYSMPRDILPKRRPRQMVYLGTVEWAWNPHSNRIEVLYLHRARRHWVLWSYDPFASEVESEWTVVGYARRRGVSQAVAARHLIVEAWLFEAEERSLDHFHWVAQEGELSVADWRAIGHAVWPPEFNQGISNGLQTVRGVAS